MLAFDTDLAPIVGQQITLSPGASADTHARVDLLLARAAAPFVSEVLGGNTTECDVVVKGVVGGEARGWRYDAATAMFESDRAGEAAMDDPTLRALAEQAGQELTYTCHTPGAGLRAGLDRDGDGAYDRDELDAGTEPDNPGSILGACNDGIDNDGDGTIDGGDVGCDGTTANIENPGCNDGYDNNNDGLIDLMDPTCMSASGVELVPEPASVAALLALVLSFGVLGRRRVSNA